MQGLFFELKRSSIQNQWKTDCEENYWFPTCSLFLMNIKNLIT
jgi:hypothetical protein